MLVCKTISHDIADNAISINLRIGILQRLNEIFKHIEWRTHFTHLPMRIANIYVFLVITMSDETV